SRHHEKRKESVSPVSVRSSRCERVLEIRTCDLLNADDDEAAADGGKCVAAWAGGSGRDRYAVQRPPRCVSRTAVRLCPQFSSRAPPRSIAPYFDCIPFGPAHHLRRVINLTFA